MRVVDANVLIAHLDEQDALHQRAGELLEAAAAEEFAASVITLAEVLVAPARSGKLIAAREALHRLGVSALPLDHGSAERLAELRSTTGLKLPDCCVLHAAEGIDGDVLTLDARLARAAGELGLD